MLSLTLSNGTPALSECHRRQLGTMDTAPYLLLRTFSVLQSNTAVTFARNVNTEYNTLLNQTDKQYLPPHKHTQHTQHTHTHTRPAGSLQGLDYRALPQTHTNKQRTTSSPDSSKEQRDIIRRCRLEYDGLVSCAPLRAIIRCCRLEYDGLVSCVPLRTKSSLSIA